MSGQEKQQEGIDKDTAELFRNSWRLYPHTFAYKASRSKWVPYKHLRYISIQLANAVMQGGGRFIITCPPRHGKSQLISNWLPTWFLYNCPDKRVILASYALEFASKWGAEVKANLSQNPLILTEISKNTKAKKKFATLEGGQMICAGVGGPITGEGAELFIIDDPLKNYQEAMSDLVRERHKDWYRSVVRTRLEPGATVVILQCMTGDTGVLMADGTQTPLRDIKIGDSIATYENGKIAVSTIKNWKCCGPDNVYVIKTSSGITVKANERHPFLVCRNGELQWVPLRDLRVNEKLMRVGDRYKGNFVQDAGVENQQSVKACACLITIKQSGRQDTDHHPLIQNTKEQSICGTDTELLRKIMTECLKSKMEIVQSVSDTQEIVLQNVGSKDCVLTTVTDLEKSEPYYVTIATSSSNTVTPNKSYNQQLSIYEDTIVEILQAGYEEVFDIQVDRTENFIANGLVSHNTRWHEDDLAGWLISHKDKEDDPNSKPWTVINLPAICEEEVDVLGRKRGEALCPERYDVKALSEIESDLDDLIWSALYQQRPTALKGNIILKEWLKFYDTRPSAFDEQAIFADLTFKEGTTTDFTVVECWGRAGASIFLLDQIRARMGFPDQIAAIREMGRRYPDAYLKQIEEAANGAAVIDMLKSELMGLVAVKPHTSKQARLAAVSPLYQAGNVYYPNAKICPWIATNIAEVLTFPNAKHDDTVDVASMAVNHLGKVSKSIARLEALNRW